VFRMSFYKLELIKYCNFFVCFDFIVHIQEIAFAILMLLRLINIIVATKGDVLLP